MNEFREAGDPAAVTSAQLLTAVLERAPRLLAELAEALGVPAEDLERAAAVLEDHGLVAWDAQRAGLRPGPAILHFARSGAGLEDLVELAQPSLRRLAQES
ncbi:MAG: hypothetical protein JO179_10715, partial [Solirubrobacterales bacterium]|nr:hypothetical protein [Solirubrobacterales bacterium]